VYLRYNGHDKEYFLSTPDGFCAMMHTLLRIAQLVNFKEFGEHSYTLYPRADIREHRVRSLCMELIDIFIKEMKIESVSNRSYVSNLIYDW
jgi:hypothetical protein